MEALLQRLAGFASTAMPFAVRDGDAPDPPDRPATRVFTAARWVLWVGLLILPGSFLLLPVLLWRRTSKTADRVRRSHELCLSRRARNARCQRET